MLVDARAMGYVEGLYIYCVDVIPINGWYATFVAVVIQN
jgi:hypothetical protein